MKSDAVLWRLGAVFLASEKAIAIVRRKSALLGKKRLILQNNQIIKQIIVSLFKAVLPIQQTTTRCSVIKLSLLLHSNYFYLN